LINLLWVAAGGGLGASLRYITSNIFRFFYPNLPFGTIFVNILGSFLIGVFISMLERGTQSESFIKYFLIIGLLGSYTTFSTFSFEVIELYNNKKFILSFVYIFVSILTCIFAAYVGYNINKIEF
tara:strand:+ start:146 stop:520 length:375 start_codon:yes stop_codon:yes gene_type:complete